MKIEPASVDDIPQLVDFLRNLFDIELDFTADASLQQRGLELLLADMAAGGKRAVVMVARDLSGEAVGMATAQLVISTAEGAPSAWIEDVIVQRDHRRQGIARLLVNAILDWAQKRGATRAQLVMDETNAGAELFYNGIGWDHTHLKVRRHFIV
jgi:GNAT superfamily N-acetyltransferase